MTRSIDREAEQMPQAGRAWVPINPDLRGFQRQMSAGMQKAGVEAGRTFAARFKDELRASLRDLPTAKIAAQADITKADAELDRTARNRTAKVKVDADTGKAVVKLGLLSRSAGGASTALENLGSAGIGFVNPITAAVGALAAVMSGPLIAALLPITAGFAGFAAAGVGEFTRVTTAQQKLTAARAAYDKATTKAGRASALRAEAAAAAGLTGSEKTLMGQMTGLRREWGKLQAAVRPEIVRGFGTALKIVKDLMPALRPLMVAAGKAADYFLGQIDSWLKSPSGKKFIKWLETDGPKDIKRFGKVMWDIAQGIGRTFSWLNNAGNTWWRNVFHTTGLAVNAYKNMKNWLWTDFTLVLVRFFTKTIPTAFDLFRLYVRLTWDKVETSALNFVFRLTGIMSKLPGPLGAPFREAHKAIGTELGKIAADVSKTAGKINADWAKLHGKKVALTWSLNLPAGVSYPSRHIKGHGAKGITGAAAGAWLVGEEGPELAWLPRGTNVLPARPTAKILGGLANGVGDFTGVLPSFAAINRATAAMQKFSDALDAKITKQLQINAAAFAYSGGYTGGGPTGGQQYALEKYAASLFPRYGWSGLQILPLGALWTQESGWNRMAYNASSGATGIPQALPYSKMPRAAWLPFQGGQASAAAQIQWGENYIATTPGYGTPAAAWAHERAFGWYAGGSWSVPETGPAMVHQGEIIIPPSVAPALRAALAQGGRQDVSVSVLLDGRAIEPRMYKVVSEADRQFNRRVSAGTGRR